MVESRTGMVTNMKNLKPMQKTIREETTNLQLRVYNAFDGDSIDFDKLDDIEAQLCFLYERVSELNGS